MKPTLETPSTIVLALWVASDRAACTAVLRADSSDVTVLKFEAWGEPLATLAKALEVTQVVKAKHCVIVTNWDALFASVAPLHLGDQGDAHWQVIALLATRYAGRYAAMKAETLPRTEEAWKRHWALA